MDEAHLRPWDPDRRWADPLITLLLLLSLLGAWSAVASQRAARTEPRRAGPQARIQELGQAAFARHPSPAFQKPLQVPPGNHYWDKALLTILAAERGDRSWQPPLQEPAKPEGPEVLFPRAWAAAYASGALPSADDLERLREPLGDGFAYWSLRARLAGRMSQDPAPYRSHANRWATPRLTALGILGVSVVVLGLGGLVAGMVFLFSRKGPRPKAPLPEPGMSGRALLLTLLGWFLALRVSGMVAFTLLSLFHLPSALALPVACLFHAAVGISLMLRCADLRLKDAWRILTPGPRARALGWALPFLGIAIAAVVVAGILASPLTRGADSPQRDLIDLVSGTRNPLLILLLLLTVAGLAPLFEEWLFRGFLLPWLGRRLSPRLGERGGWALAILASGLSFGAIHLQPAGLPTLATLGLVLGWAFRRTGNLWTSVAIHASWNAGVFVFMRILA